MENLWAPWRLAYVKREEPSVGCPFCDHSNPFALWIGQHASIFLNRFPYANGHTMIVPNRHLSTVNDLTDAEVHSMHHLRVTTIKVLQEWMRPHGFNLGYNLGEVAGAGVLGHIHEHIVPRWPGDVNFMPVLDDIKVIPQHIETTREEMRERLSEALQACDY